MIVCLFANTFQYPDRYIFLMGRDLIKNINIERMSIWVNIGGMIFGFVKDGKVEVYDLYSTGNFGPHSLDTELGGTDDILNYNGKEEGGFTTIEFKRSLGTGDQYDIPIQKGVNKIIWAYGSNDSLMVKHSTRGYGEINL